MLRFVKMNSTVEESFLKLHKARPNSDDLKLAREFAREIIK